MRKAKLTIVSAMIALIGGFANANEPSWIDHVDSIVEQMIEARQAVGISIAIGIDGEVVYQRAVGMADLEHNVPLRTDSLMRIGSVTKQFTAAAILMLVDQGKLSLDTTLAEALPDWPIPIDPISGKAITIEQMLKHTSGLANHSGIERFVVDFAAKPLSLTDLADLIREEPFTHEPGTEWRYCNTAYWLLGKVVERYSESTLELVYNDWLLEPAGLERTRLDWNRTVIADRVQGYDITPDGIFHDQPIEMMNVEGGGALLSTPRELVMWTFALSSGAIVPMHVYNGMSSVQANTSYDGWAYGYGLVIDTTSDRPRVFHTGGIDGFNTVLVRYLPMDFDPRDIVVAVICNGTDPDARVQTRNATVAEVRIAEAVLAATE